MLGLQTGRRSRRPLRVRHFVAKYAAENEKTIRDVTPEGELRDLIKEHRPFARRAEDAGLVELRAGDR